MHVLDNPIWCALTTRLAHLGARDSSASKFDRDVSLLGGFGEHSPGADADAYASMARLLAIGEQVGVFVESANATTELEIATSVPLLQMVREDADAPKPAIDASALVALTDADVPDMIALTELTKPGPFNRRTREMGDYFGIRRDGVLVAMAGERLRVPGYTEISAVCTHPDHLGHGYAATLMASLIRRIHERGERACLHVRPENTRAVAIYERLGFHERQRSRYIVLQRRA